MMSASAARHLHGPTKEAAGFAATLACAIAVGSCAGGAPGTGAAHQTPATTQSVRHFTPTELALGPSGALFVSDCHHGYVFKIGNFGKLTVVTGTGMTSPSGTFSADGGPAVQAEVACPYGLVFDSKGALVFADHANNRIRWIDPDGAITTIVGSGPIGTGAGGFGGDGGMALRAQLNAPFRCCSTGTATSIGDPDNGAIRKVTPQGIITTIAGTVLAGYSGDGGLATAAAMQPDDVVFDSVGNLYFAEFGNHVVCRIDTSGTIRRIAGTGKEGCSGYGGAATAAQLTSPLSPAVDATGNLDITDQGCNVERPIAADPMLMDSARPGVDELCPGSMSGSDVKARLKAY